MRPACSRGHWLSTSCAGLRCRQHREGPWADKAPGGLLKDRILERRGSGRAGIVAALTFSLWCAARCGSDGASLFQRPAPSGSPQHRDSSRRARHGRSFGPGANTSAGRSDSPSKLPLPRGGLLGLTPPHHAPGGRDEGGLPSRGEARFAGLHPPIAPQDLRFGLGVPSQFESGKGVSNRCCASSGDGHVVGTSTKNGSCHFFPRTSCGRMNRYDLAWKSGSIVKRVVEPNRREGGWRGPHGQRR